MPCHAKCPRIVLVDDEDFVHEMVDLVLRESLTDYTLVKFLNRDEAWQELLRQPPDLLITDMLSTNVPGRTEDFGMSGGELRQRLAERRVSSPILVVSGSFSISGWVGMQPETGGGPHAFDNGHKMIPLNLTATRERYNQPSVPLDRKLKRTCRNSPQI